MDDNAILVTIRPPSVTGNYHDRRSEELFVACLPHFTSFDDVHVLVVNRTSAELSLIDPAIRDRPNISILETPVDGLQLLWHSDLVVSGGGTMNREAALLGIPTFSIFTGRKPYLDEFLHKQGRLQFADHPRMIRAIHPRKRVISDTYLPGGHSLAATVTDILLEVSNSR